MMTSINLYSKEQTDALLNDKADASDVYTKTEIDEKNIGVPDDTASASGSLWARIKYILAHWLTTDTEQTVSAKKTFSVSPEVPATPANEQSAINQTWAENVAYSDDTVNNLVHKEGNEVIFGDKTFRRPISINKNTSTFKIDTYIEGSGQGLASFEVSSSNGYTAKLFLIAKSNNEVQLLLQKWDNNGQWVGEQTIVNF